MSTSALPKKDHLKEAQNLHKKFIEASKNKDINEIKNAQKEIIQQKENRKNIIKKLTTKK